MEVDGEKLHCLGRGRAATEPKGISKACNEVGDQPFPLEVRTPDGSIIARLLTGPRCTVLSMKRQLAGIEGTPIDNQTLLLGGRILNDTATLSSSGVSSEVSLVLVRCVPLLAGNLSTADLRRLTTDDDALGRSIDGFKADPCYSAVEVEEIVSAVVRALLPSEPGLVLEILDSLPLSLLSSSLTDIGHVGAKASPNEVDGKSATVAEEPASELPECSMKEPAGVEQFDISDAEPWLPQKMRRERFTSCVHAALQVILLALEERCTNPS